MNRDFDIISLDIETSGVGYPNAVFGTNPHTNQVVPFALLSIGCVRLSDFGTFYAEVKHESLWASPGAFRVHGLDIEKMDGGATGVSYSEPAPLTVEEVDTKLVDWLKSDKYYQEGKKYCLVPMGMNVGSFDMQFVQYWLPKTGRLFGYRSIDLNALTFIDALRHDREFADVKKAAKQLGKSFAVAQFPNGKPHNALYDAWTNVGYFNYLVNPDAQSTVGQVSWEGGKINV